MSSKPKVTTTEESKKAKTKTQQTGETASSRNPWDPAEGHFKDLYGAAGDAFSLTNNKTFGGDYIAPPTTAQRSSVQQLLSAAPDLGIGTVPLRDMAKRIAGGEFLDPNNPTLRAGIDATVNPLGTKLRNEIIPGITDAAIKGGAYGGTSQALLETQALDDYARASHDISGKMTLDWMNNRFGDIFQTPGMFQGANTLALAPGTVTGLAGETERGLDQLGVDNDLKKYENSMAAPWFGMQDFASLLTAGGFGDATGQTSGSSSGATTGTGVQTETGAAPDMMTQILQGGLGGLGMLSSLGTAFPATMGAIGGGSVMAPLLSILGGLSDRRFKEDIVKVGQLYNGLPIYRYRFIGQPGTIIGVMADEVEKVKPEAVLTSPAGIKYVDYLKATEN